MIIWKRTAGVILAVMSSIYFTFIVDVYTLDTRFQKIFVLSFFVLMSGLLVYLKRKYVCSSITKLSLGASVIVSLILLTIFQNLFLPREKENYININATGDGEIWLTDVKIDGEPISIKDLNVLQSTNWEYNKNYDDYVYYPYVNQKENELNIKFLGETININFAVNDWSGTVDVEGTGGEIRQIDLHDEEEGTFEYQCSGVRQYHRSERIFFSVGIFIAINFCISTLFGVLEKRARVSPWKIAAFSVFAILFATIATFQSVLAVIGDVPIQYIFSIKNEKNPKSAGAEVRIYNIKVSGTKYDLTLLSDYGSIQEDGTLLIYPYNADVSFNIDTSIFDTVSVDLLQHPWSGIVNISNGVENDTVDLYSETSQTITREYKYENLNEYILNYVNANKLDLAVLWCLFAVISFACLGIIRTLLDKLSSGKFSWRMIPLLSIMLFILAIFSVYACLYISPIITVGIVTAVGIFLVVKIRNVISTHLENLYIIIAVIYGVSMILILPIGHVPDEFAHEAKCYAMSEGYANTTRDRYAVWLPKETSETFAFFSKDIMYIDLKYSPIDVLSSYKNSTNFDSDLVWTHSSNTLSLNEFAYFPATLVVAAAHFIPMSPTLIFQLGRLLNFIIAGILFYLAIKITPCFKRIFFMIALFPIAIQQTAAVNQDWITNAVIFLFVAIVFRMAFETSEINRADYIRILVLSACLGMVKLAYFPVAFLTFLIPTKKFGELHILTDSKGQSLSESRRNMTVSFQWNRSYRAWLFKLLIVVLAFGLAVLQAFPSYLSEEQHYADCNFFTLHMVLEYPLKALKICWNTFNERATLDFCDGLLNGFGWSIKWTTGIKRSLVMMAALFLVLTNQEKNVKLRVDHKAILLCAMLGMWGMVYMALLTGWTDANSPTIAGLQSRYFIPIILLMYILFHNHTFQNKSKKINCWFCGFALVALTVGLKTLTCGYYQL